MPNVVREDIDNLNAVLKVVIGKEDYEPKFNDELKKLRSKASLKGFRKGKTPVNFLKKMYGKGLLNDIVTDMLQEQLTEAINDEKLNYLGRPIPAEDFQPVDFDVNKLKDYEFKFQVGMAPEFEVKGVADETTYDYYKVEVPKEKVDEQIDMIRRRKGERFEAEDEIQEDDLITLNAVELEDDKPKEDGWKTTFTIIGSRITDDLKAEFLKKKQGDTIRFDIYKLENDANREYVKKYLLNFTEADVEEGTETNDIYEATIEKVERLKPAELTQELFDEIFGEGEVSNEEEARDIIRKNLGVQDESTANSILYNDIRKKLLDLNRDDIPLPEGFLKRWVKVGHAKEATSILNNFEDFADDMRWTLIKNKLYKKFDLKLEEKDIRDAASNRVMGYFGGQYQPGMEGMIDNIVNRMMEDQEQVNNLAGEVLSSKLFFALKEDIKLNEITISAEELSEKMKALEEENKANREKFAAVNAAEEEE